MKRFDPDSISDDELLNELRKLADELGHAPSQNDVKKFGNDITKRIYLYRRRFGSFQSAQEKIGYAKNLCGNDLKYSDEELLNEIKRIASVLGCTPTQDDLQKHGKYPPGAFKRHFGTYNDALKKLGLRHNLKYGQTIDDIKQDILFVAKLLDHTPTVDEFNKYSNTVCFLTAARKVSNSESWNAALKICGLEIAHNKNLSDQEMKDEITRLQSILGRIPGYYDMIQLGKYSPESYAHNYGTYVKALNYFGFNYTPQNQWHNQAFTQGKDGTMYKSKFEALIADILLNIKNSGGIVSYIYEKRVCDERKWTCDFYVKINDKELWIEADGMGKNRAEVYNDEHEKIKYYIENNKNFYIINYGKGGLVEEINNLIGKNK